MAYRLEQIGFTYEGASAPVLRGIDAEIPEGRITLLLGGSGSGKTTLIEVLTRIAPEYRPGAVQGLFHGPSAGWSDLKLKQIARHIGLVFQNPESQFCTYTVWDELAFGLENLSVPPAEIEKRVEAVLALVGIESLRSRPLHTLSGGEKQKVAVASVLTPDPPLLIFDEPTANLDPAGIRDMFQILSRLKTEARKTILIVEHQLEYLIGRADHLLILGSDGRLLFGGNVQDGLDFLIRQPDLPVHLPPAVDFLRRLSVKPGRPVLTDSAVADWIRRNGSSKAPKSGTGASDRVSATSPAPAPAASAPASVTSPAPEPAASAPASVTSPAPEPAASAPASATPPAPAGLSPFAAPAVLASQKVPAPVSAAPPVLSCRGLEVSLAGTPVLRGVDLEIRQGDFLAVVGPNAAGKTTLMLSLLGFYPARSGSVTLFGQPLNQLRRRKWQYAGIAFQNPEWQFVADTVWDELQYSLKPARMTQAEKDAAVREYLEQFGLWEKRALNPFVLSQGEKRRLSVAAVLVRRQKLLILDEPTFGQDLRSQNELMGLMRTLNENGVTVVMVSHQMDIVYRYCNRAVLLADGRIAFDGAPRALFLNRALCARGRLEQPFWLRVARQLPGQPDLRSPEDAVQRYTL